MACKIHEHPQKMGRPPGQAKAFSRSRITGQSPTGFSGEGVELSVMFRKRRVDRGRGTSDRQKQAAVKK